MTESRLPEISTLATLNLEADVARESLLIVYRGMPSALLSHLLISSFVVFALWPVIAAQQLLAWGLFVWLVAGIRWFNSDGRYQVGGSSQFFLVLLPPHCAAHDVCPHSRWRATRIDFGGDGAAVQLYHAVFGP
jgi:nitrate reductase NapE component